MLHLLGTFRDLSMKLFHPNLRNFDCEMLVEGVATDVVALDDVYTRNPCVSFLQQRRAERARAEDSRYGIGQGVLEFRNSVAEENGQRSEGDGAGGTLFECLKR